MKSHNSYQKKRVNPIELRKNCLKIYRLVFKQNTQIVKNKCCCATQAPPSKFVTMLQTMEDPSDFLGLSASAEGKNWSERSECASEPTMCPLNYRHYHFLLSFSPCSLLFSFADRVKCKIWSKMKLSNTNNNINAIVKIQ